MSIPIGFPPPAIPSATLVYTQQYQEATLNAIRLYFSQLDTHNRILREQVAATNTLLWLGL